ncbi:pirin family protein [Candidatus Protofrankia californiensis]|uniref:pirin family protein n=1 Tax=Candidatus Protofrankia californiensis TaxID=1839754 RepID=UPI0010410769
MRATVTDISALRGAGIAVRRADSRTVTRNHWLDSRHSFAFGRHYDPANTHFGLLLVTNDDHVAPGGGFETHSHRDMEIVTWVLDGELLHTDSTGTRGVIRPGIAQRMSAGTGILHAETNAVASPGAADTPDIAGCGCAPGDPGTVHFIQMWVIPDLAGITSSYAQMDVTDALASGELVAVAGGVGSNAAIDIQQRNAVLHAARLPTSGRVQLPSAPWVHLFVTRGRVTVEGAGELGTGDAARIRGCDGLSVVSEAGPAEILVWEMHAALGR